MSKSILTIEKEILKKEHEKTPLGIIEKDLRKFYDGLVTTGQKLPEDIAEQVYRIREGNEKTVGDYVETRLKLDKQAVDDFLLEAMTKELEILNNFKATK